jgi:hypothetical protein
VQSLVDGVRSLLEARNAYHALLAESYDRMMDDTLRRSVMRLLFAPRWRLATGIVGWQVARTARYFLDHVGALPETDHISIRYEDLCRDPAAVVGRSLSFLGLPEKPEVPYRDFIRVRERRRPPEGERAFLRRLRLEPYLAYCGYDSY